MTTLSTPQALDLAILALNTLAHPEGTMESEARDRLTTCTPAALQVLTTLRAAAAQVESEDAPPTQDTIYDAYDRWVCLRPQCAGIQASATGVTLGGYRILPLSPSQVQDWTRQTGQESVSCECGRLRAALDPQGRLRVTDTHK